MKKSILLSLLSVSFLISCSKNDDNTPSTPVPSIVGKWDLKAKMVGTTAVALYPCEEQYNQFEFFSNLTYVEDEGYTNNGTSCTHYTFSNSYSISNNNLIINDDDGIVQTESHLKIIELTQTKLKLKLFYIKEKQNGVVTSEENIPENQQRTTSFDKI